MTMKGPKQMKRGKAMKRFNLKKKPAGKVVVAAMDPQLRLQRISKLPPTCRPTSTTAKSWQVKVLNGKIECNVERAHFYVWNAKAGEKVVSFREDQDLTPTDAWTKALNLHTEALRCSRSSQ